MVVFVALGLVLRSRDMTMTGNALVATVIGATILSGLIIAGFFI